MQVEEDRMASRSAAETYSDGRVTPGDLGYSLMTAARRWPEREFVLFDGQRLTYRDIAGWTLRVAADMLAHGVRPRDRVLIQAPNRPEVAVLQFAAWRIGAIAVPVIPVYRQHELRQIVADASPSIVAAMSRHGSRSPCSELDEVLAEGGVEPAVRYALDAGDDQTGWTQLPGWSPADTLAGTDDFPVPADPGACHLILYTSGTTAKPKGAMLTGAGVLSNCASMIRTLGLTERDVFVAGSPIAHVAGMSMGVILPMSLGARTVLMLGWEPDRAVELIEHERATFMSSAPVFLSDLVDRYETGGGGAHRLSTYMSGGATTPPSLIRRADAVGVRASRIYGMTETAGVCAMARPDDPLEMRSQTDGRVVLGTEIEIVDEGRKPLPSGRIGEVRLHSPQLMTAYTDPAATNRQIDADGWFYPGDIGQVDASGWFTMIGRTKDIINRGGEKFSSQDIEHALASYPDVAAAAVLGAPDDRLGEVVAAVLELRPGVSWAGPEDLLAHLDQAKLAKQKMPVRWHIVDRIPTTPTGKVQKEKLLAMLTDQGTAA
jgi:acyl-CoA synthetase